MALMPGVNKEKRRNSEKRKEKSRDAARCRRSKETEIYCQLANQLPLTFTQLDKASLMRLSISYLKIRKLLNPAAEILKSLPSNSSKWDSAFLKALEGFLLVLSEEGDIVYLSENVHQYLGLTQIDFMGHSIYDFSHPCDHEEIKEMLSFKDNENAGLSLLRSFFLRLKCTLTNKGRNVNVKSASYKVIHCNGYIVNDIPLVKMEEQSYKTDHTPISFFISVGEPIPHPSNIEILLDKQTFLSRHSLDMKFTYVDERIEDLLEYKEEELQGKSVYQYHHALDTRIIEKNFKIMFSKGQCETGPYRFLAKHGGYVWLLTQGTVIYENNSSKPQCVVCVNYVLSGIENKNEVVSGEQKTKELESLQEPLIFKSSTQNLFCRRTEDMTKGFVVFSEENNGLTECKDEPEDLTHLAPKMADFSISLDCSPYSSDTNGEVMVLEDAKSLSGKSLAVEVPSLFSDCDSPVNSDPFLNYRDDTLYSPLSVETMSPCLSKSVSSSISDLSGSKTCSSMVDLPTLETPMESMTSLDLKLGTSEVFTEDKSDIQDEELIERAPYIPMTTTDDCLLLNLPENKMCGPQGYPRRRSLSHSPCRPIFDLEDALTSPRVSPAASTTSLSPNSHISSYGKGIRSREDRSVLLMDKRCKNLRAISSRSLSSSAIDHGGGFSRAVYKNVTNNGKIVLTEKLPVSQEVLTPVSGDYEKHIILPKVCVTSVDEFSNTAETAHFISALKDMPFKRTSTTFQAPLNSPKRMKFESGQLTNETCTNASVLLNLLINGEDVSYGYITCNTKMDTKSCPQSPLASRFEDQMLKSVNLSALLDPEGSAIPSLADITQHDAEVNAPIHSNHLLQGEDLLHALDQTVRDVSSLV
ncbi:hypoxia-inducible factor 1-alpha-like isoform X2 [Tachypleus tridentatus]|uniref:hypoxia-inducible factor 1-alpha-like isoform X2 n=1 Tax=Tachypleus tridentatus TaxID=6853 RepID=UPI003FD004A3